MSLDGQLRVHQDKQIENKFYVCRQWKIGIVPGIVKKQTFREYKALDRQRSYTFHFQPFDVTFLRPNPHRGGLMLLERPKMGWNSGSVALYMTWGKTAESL